MPDRRPPMAQPAPVNRPPQWRDLIQLALDGIYPTEARLEAMLDRIEALP